MEVVQISCKLGVESLNELSISFYSGRHMDDNFGFKVSENFIKKTEELHSNRELLCFVLNLNAFAGEGASDAQEIVGQLQNLIGQRCKDDYERYQLLDNRDKLLCSLRQVSSS